MSSKDEMSYNSEDQSGRKKIPRKKIQESFESSKQYDTNTSDSFQKLKALKVYKKVQKNRTEVSINDSSLPSQHFSSSSGGIRQIQDMPRIIPPPVYNQSYYPYESPQVPMEGYYYHPAPMYHPYSCAPTTQIGGNYPMPPPYG